MLLDGMIVFSVALLVTLFKLHNDSVDDVRAFWNGTLIPGKSTEILLGLLFGFILALMVTSRRFNLYSPKMITSFLKEQQLSLQACFISSLLLTGSLYLIKAEDIPRSIVIGTLGLSTIALSLRRMVQRLSMYRHFERGIGTRNVLIVGTGPEAQALRHHLESIRHLGYTFKGFIDHRGVDSSLSSTTKDSNIVGTFDTLFKQARKLFIDEIFFTTPPERGVVKVVLEQARHYGVNLRIVPDMYDGLAWNSAVEYIGQFPTIPLHCNRIPEVALLLKRGIDIIFSILAVIVLSPVLLAIAMIVKIDSKGPVFYRSERIGKKGIVFRCFKFRTMVADAEKRRAEIMHMNERDGVLFKCVNDPRVTKVGRFLRKYSLDELPQFFNVLLGDMSVVGPRPPIASEVKEYQLSHLRRLDVTPGITGLWQVQSRQDPSFNSYISLDMTYIENWNIWLDVKIILRTVAVVFAGTGS